MFFVLLFFLTSIVYFVKFPSTLQSKDTQTIAANFEEKPDSSKTPPSGLNWIVIPSMNTNYFHPGMPMSAGGSAAYSFSVDHDANYTLDVSAYYEDIGYNGIYYPKAAYYAPNGCWLVVAFNFPSENPDIYPADIMLGIGRSASTFRWQMIGETNFTSDIAVAANLTAIRVVYTERNASAGDDTAPVKWVQYIASNDWGAT